MPKSVFPSKHPRVLPLMQVREPTQPYLLVYLLPPLSVAQRFCYAHSGHLSVFPMLPIDKRVSLWHVAHQDKPSHDMPCFKDGHEQIKVDETKYWHRREIDPLQ